MKFFLIFLFSLSASANDLRYGSEICSSLNPENVISDEACFDSFVLQPDSEINLLDQTSNQASDFLLRVGSVNNLNEILKTKLLRTHFKTFQQNLIIAKAFGYPLNELKTPINESNCLHNEVKAAYINAIDETNNHAGEVTSEQQTAYLRKVKSAMVEVARIKQLIEIHSRRDEIGIVSSLNNDLETLYRFYPILLRVDERGNQLSDSNDNLIERIAHGYPNIENRMRHAHETDENINQILGIPEDEGIRTRYPRSRSQSRRTHFYQMIHHKIHEEGSADAMYDSRIPELAGRTINYSMSSLNHLCEASPCDTFKIIPHEIGNIVAEVEDPTMRSQLQNYVCQCQIEYTEDTLSPLVHLGILAGTVGMAFGCVSFPPLCVGAALVGIGGTGAALDDIGTLNRNFQRVSHEVTTNQAVRNRHQNTEQELARLELAAREQNTAYMFLPLELLGAGGDFATVGRQAIRWMDDLPTPIRRPQNYVERFPDAHSSRAVQSITTRQALLDQYKAYDPVDDTARRAWINLAKNDGAELFIDIENGMLKRLNDLGDKDAITALTNVHKRFVMEGIAELQAKYPGLIINTYSDFKSLRFALSGDIPANIQAEINGIFASASRQIDEFVAKLVQEGELQLPTSEVPHQWFAGGIGRTADEAGLAAREARCRSNALCTTGVMDYSSAEITEAVRTNIQNATRLRTESLNAVKNLTSDVPLTQIINGVEVPSIDLIEAVRKNLDKSDSELTALLSRRFGNGFTDEMSATLKSYIHTIKKFEPGLWIESRTLASLDEAAYGGFSADFTGMGSFNIQQTALDLAQHGDNTPNLVRALRAGEVSVTEGFDAKKDLFNRYVSEAFEDTGVPLEIKCSGDDCVAFPTGNTGLNSAQLRQMQHNLVQRINQSDTPDAFRLAFVPPSAQRTARSQLATHGELIEKNIRKLAFGTDAIPFSQSSNLTIGIRMPRSLNQGRVEVIVAGVESLTDTQRRTLDRYISQAVQAANRDAEALALEAGNEITSSYTLGNIQPIN